MTNAVPMTIVVHVGVKRCAPVNVGRRSWLEDCLVGTASLVVKCTPTPSSIRCVIDLLLKSVLLNRSVAMFNGNLVWMLSC